MMIFLLSFLLHQHPLGKINPFFPPLNVSVSVFVRNSFLIAESILAKRPKYFLFLILSTRYFLWTIILIFIIKTFHFFLKATNNKNSFSQPFADSAEHRLKGFKLRRRFLCNRICFWTFCSMEIPPFIVFNIILFIFCRCWHPLIH